MSMMIWSCSSLALGKLALTLCGHCNRRAGPDSQVKTSPTLRRDGPTIHHEQERSDPVTIHHGQERTDPEGMGLGELDPSLT